MATSSGAIKAMRTIIGILFLSVTIFCKKKIYPYFYVSSKHEGTMNAFVKFTISLLAALFSFTAISAHAAEPTDIEKAMQTIVKKYDGTDGVECMTLAKGTGLELLKMALKKGFGKTFTQGITSITVIDYSDASEQTCKSLHSDMDVFLTLLEEFDLSKHEEFSKNKYIRCFAASSSSGSISDFIIALENNESKTIMHMSGEIRIE